MNLGFLKLLLFLFAFMAFLSTTFKILKEYERAVIFRLGKFYRTKGPGLIFLIPLVDRLKKIDLRLVSIDVPRQDIMTKDNVPVTVDAVVYFQITDPAKAVIGIQNIYQSTFLIAQTSLRNILGRVELDDLLSQQDKINHHLQETITKHTNQWGIKIPIVEVKEVTLPEEMKRVMAKQAEVERERRARIIDAQGEFQAAKTLARAGEILSNNPESLQLRYLQTLRDISVQKGSTIVFPFPLDLISPFVEGVKKFLSPKESPKDSPIDSPIDSPKERPSLYAKEHKKREVQKDTDDSLPEIPQDFNIQESQQIKTEQTIQGDQTIQAEQKTPPLPPSPQKEILANHQKAWRQGRLKPAYVQWVSTDRCQFQCAHCETTSQKINPGELTTDEMKKIIDELAEMGAEFFSISGGEPFHRRHIFSLCD